MVLIESDSDDEQISLKEPSQPEPSEAKLDDSDGYETASERDVSDTEADVTDTKQEEHVDATNDDQSKQKEKAMEEANEAKLEGNKLFGNALYEDALSKYELALHFAKESVEIRAICYSNRAICYIKLGKYTEAVKECTKAIELNPSYMKAFVRRAEAYEKLENFEDALTDLKKIIELDSSNNEAKKGIRRLEPLAAEKREKMKEEAIAKLKEMGNTILGKFGMSLDNFKAVQDPNTGSYSFSMNN